MNIQLMHITKIFKDPQSKKDVLAVDDADFEIYAGELVTLLGPSGCGKTTTLRMIAGFEIPTKGKIMIGSQEITQLPPNLRDTAMVFQSYGLFPHMDVFQNVAYGLKIRKIPRPQISERVNRVLDIVGLKHLAHRPPARLSGGQQQRVALARSLVVEPAVLLLDEPLSNLDALLREQMRVEIRRIQQSLKITAVYVTHDRVEAMSLSDRVVVMNDGKIVQIGPPQEIYEDPCSQFVAGFIGKVAFFKGEVVEMGETCVVESLGKKVPFTRFDPNLTKGDQVVIMCRPESMVVADKGEGIIDGTVVTNIYLGHSVESYISTSMGEILVQIDNPALKKIHPQGETVSIQIVTELAKVLKGS